MKKIDLTDKKFNRLLVLEEVPKETRNHHKPVWKCKCDCGKIINVGSYHLKSGNTKSCGCLRSESSSERLSKIARSNRKYVPQEAAAMDIYRQRYNDGDIPFDEFYKVLSQMDCFYCDRPPQIISFRQKADRLDDYNQNCKLVWNGLDRLNNNLPHNKNNVVSCCVACNFAKNDQTPRAFYEQVQLIHANIVNKNITDLTVKSVPNTETIRAMMITFGLYKNGKATEIKTKYHRLYKSYKCTDISFEVFFYLTQQNCAYCVRKPFNYHRINNEERFYCSGLDRISSLREHSLDNIVPCCKYCNYAKSILSYEEFKEFIALLFVNFTEDKVRYLEENFEISNNIREEKPLKKRKRSPYKPKPKREFLPGEQSGMVGYKFSETSRKKMSDTAKEQDRSKGSKNPKASITEEQVIQVKVLLKTKGTNEVAKIMSISKRKVRRIKSGETWAHIIM